MIESLVNRVSFEVFQDTEEDGIWNKLQGGKDDVYIYDRCGKLAYYIPYPLSIMTIADGLVPKAVVATYFNSPCGNSCEANATFSTPGYNESIETTTQFNIVTTLTGKTELNSNVSENYTNVLQQETHVHNSNESNLETLNETNSVLRLVTNTNDNSTPIPESNEFLINTFNVTINESTSEIHTSNLHAHNAEPEDNQVVKRDLANGTRRPDRCKEADTVVCRDFTKKKLLKVQTCCMLGNNQRTRSCKPFTPRKCKKMKMVIKCCIKTSISEETTTALPSMEESSTYCCRDTIDGKICRTAPNGICDQNGEYEEIRNYIEEDVADNSNDI